MPNDTMPIHIKNGNSYSGYNFITPTDTEDCVVTFTSSDNDATTAKTTDGMTSVTTLESGETHESLFQKISKMFLNIRKLWNTVGETDISGIGTTITGAISTLEDKSIKVEEMYPTSVTDGGENIHFSNLPFSNYEVVGCSYEGARLLPYHKSNTNYWVLYRMTGATITTSTKVRIAYISLT